MLADSTPHLEEPPIVSCPISLRQDALRALGHRMKQLDAEMLACRRRALELGLDIQGARILTARGPWADASRLLLEDPR